MQAVFVDPAIQGHIPGVLGQGRRQTGRWQYPQGRNRPPTGLGAQPIEPATAVAQAQASAIQGQTGQQQGGHGSGRQWRAGQRGGDAAVIRRQRISGSPGPVAQAQLGILSRAGDGGQSKTP